MPNWNYPTAILFGNGRVSELPKLCEALHMHCPLIVTDPGLAQFPFILAIEQALPYAGMFCDIKANPIGKNIVAGVSVFKQGQHDGIIAIGGGSALDAGKAIALMVGQSLPIWEFEDIADNWLKVDTDKVAPIIAIPTTAGTGSEVGRAAVIVDEKNKSKKIIFHPSMLPQQVILDPQLSQALPPKLTAATGLDAFVHNFEAFCAPSYHPMADGIALQGMKLIKEWLPIAYHDGQNLNARGHMLSASTMGATAFQKGLGACHALAHPLGALYDKHHGLLNAILLPYVVQRNTPAIRDKLQIICEFLSIKKQPRQTDYAEAFLTWLCEFRQQLDIPNTLADIGIYTDDDIAQANTIGELACADPSASGNPILFTADQYQQLFHNAVSGG